MRNVLGAYGVPTLHAKQIVDGYVRLVERSIVEYQRARAAIYRLLQPGGLQDYYDAQDHFENCIHNVHRAILYLERLRRFGFRKRDGSVFIPRPRDLEVLSETARQAVRNLRDSIEHLDQDIVEGRIPHADPVALHAGRTSIRLQGNEVSYEDLARWITQLHGFASLMSRYEISIASGDSATSTVRHN
jgi:hypothetical protein